MIVEVSQKILSANDKKANELRARFNAKNLFVINLMSSPGSGKTTFLECLAENGLKFGVIEGDLETNRDAQRLQARGIPAYQITTGDACHLEASMVEVAFDALEAQLQEFLFIENVGNLVCPASYDLGANINIVALSTPEGDDKILKYPTMFLCADIVLITKYDILEHFDFDYSRVEGDLKKLNPRAKIFKIAAKNNTGINEFIAHLRELKASGFVSNYIFK